MARWLHSGRSRSVWAGAVRLAIACAAFACVAVPALAGHRDGVDSPAVSSTGAGPGPPAAPLPGEELVDFDDVTAPCAFYQTAPLRDHYLARGVRFSGLSPAAGGAILNWCGSFDVTGYSGANFLAFNAFSPYGEPFGPTAAPPEFLDFTLPVAAVSVRVGTGDPAYVGGTALLRGFDGANALVASKSLVIGPALQLLSVSAPGIVRVEVDGPYIMVVDDLRFTLDLVVPARASTWARLKAAYR